MFTSLRYFRDDLISHPPDHFVCVPLVLDTLYNKVRHTQAQLLTHCCWLAYSHLGRVPSHLRRATVCMLEFCLDICLEYWMSLMSLCYVK